MIWSLLVFWLCVAVCAFALARAVYQGLCRVFVLAMAPVRLLKLRRGYVWMETAPHGRRYRFIPVFAFEGDSALITWRHWRWIYGRKASA